MAGRLALSTPWAREGITPEERAEVEAAIPDGYMVGVSVEARRARWILWTKSPEGDVSPQLRVSRTMRLRDAVLWALREHWQVAA